MYCSIVLVFTIFLLGACTGSPASIDPDPTMLSMPMVDLGYARYRASKYEEDGDYYIFSNIRYAAPPTGSRRFQLPEPPFDEDEVNDGSVGHACYQATNIQFKWLDLLMTPDKQSEDCLFLDVYVPGWLVRDQMDVFQSSLANVTIAMSPVKGSGSSKRLPVLTWVHGGGYTFGEKGGIHNPKGLIKIAEGRMVYVALNYRLGAFGFLAGEEINSKGATNAGYHDQRMAFEWINRHIDKFYGNPDDVTVMGESAGASSLLHHLTAPEDVLFRRAILQSTAFYPQYDNDVLEAQYQKFASLAGCDCDDSFECLMSADVADLARANKDAVFDTLYGTFQFGPYVDGEFVPLLPALRLAYGTYNRDVEIMAAYNIDEGFIFSDPTVVTPMQFDALVHRHFPNADEEDIEEVKHLYPGRDYLTYFSRVSSIIAEWIVECNSWFLEAAYPGAYLYRFAVHPGIHSADIPLTFWGGDPVLEAAGRSLLLADNIEDLAMSFQSYLVSFAVSGDPNTYRLENNSMPTLYFPKSDEWRGIPMIDVNRRGFAYLSLQDDGPVEERCEFWQEGYWTGRYDPF
ncbi:Carboxylesterase [Lipomyces kononenkoae]|uniref:Carboxylesterase n=1 Tax=Lipomyces kononenkoae TaxID=34357 RepID=A0ACC3SZV2_LIPKO